MAKTLQNAVKKYFSFLEINHGFKITKEEKSNYGFVVTYLSPHCGLRLSFESREALFLIVLYKLKNRRIVEMPLSLRNKNQITGISLDDIVALRAPKKGLKPLYSYKEKSRFRDPKTGLDSYFKQAAKNLRKYAHDVLNGDFHIMEKIKPVMMQRVSEDDVLSAN